MTLTRTRNDRTKQADWRRTSHRGHTNSRCPDASVPERRLVGELWAASACAATRSGWSALHADPDLAVGESG